MGIIIQAIIAGVSRISIIAKYGKKAYNAVISKYGSRSEIIKNAKKKDLDLGAAIIGFGIGSGTGAAVLGEKTKNKRLKKEDKAKRGPRDEKTYSKGGGVRKPKY